MLKIFSEDDTTITPLRKNMPSFAISQDKYQLETPGFIKYHVAIKCHLGESLDLTRLKTYMRTTKQVLPDNDKRLEKVRKYPL